MMRNIRISSRLLLLITVQVVALLAVGGVGLLSMESATRTQTLLKNIVKNESNLNRLNETIRINLLDIVNDLNQGRSTWEEARAVLPLGRTRFDQDWLNYFNSLSPDDAELAQDIHSPSLIGVQQAFDTMEAITKARDRGRLELFATNDFNELVEPYLNALQSRARLGEADSQQAFVNAQESNQFFFRTTIVVFAIGLVIVGFLGTAIYRSISQPIAKIADTVRQVAAGGMDARSGIEGKDELGELGQAFDQLVEDKVTTLGRAEKENEALNSSIIALLQAVSQLSQRDLTVQVPVSEDVTGPVADALNLLTNETAEVLQRVRQISDDVARAANRVKSQSDAVIGVANAEHEQIVKTSTELAEASVAMNEIAELAQACNVAADKAIQQTQTALETVTNTVAGINNTRDTIRETEKRIKRLGERSQEISGAVNLINNIAERTHILALNASMHAASAGEAGRGFAVVADEVQRLAENAREATSQIADLVSNIQTETTDTVTTMNTAISQVVMGSQLAEQAGERMTETQRMTAELVQAVQQIAEGSQTQAQFTSELRNRARQIEESTKETQHQLQEQTRQTENLLSSSKGLVESVRIFTLPSTETQEPIFQEGNLRVVQG